MQPFLLRSAMMFGVVLTAGMATSTSAQTQPTPDLKARCAQLINYYERYGASRSENSDGARNMTNMGARIDCEQGRYEKGIASMEALFKRKGFDVPPQTTGVAETPTTLRPHGEKRHSTGQ